MSYVVVDTETTGGRHAGADRITELAAVVGGNAEMAELFGTLINTQRPVPYFWNQPPTPHR